MSATGKALQDSKTLIRAQIDPDPMNVYLVRWWTRGATCCKMIKFVGRRIICAGGNEGGSHGKKLPCGNILKDVPVSYTYVSPNIVGVFCCEKYPQYTKSHILYGLII